jgi:hypothetical protein
VSSKYEAESDIDKLVALRCFLLYDWAFGHPTWLLENVCVRERHEVSGTVTVLAGSIDPSCALLFQSRVSLGPRKFQQITDIKESVGMP